MRFKIPASITIASVRYKVEQDRQLAAEGLRGRTVHAKCKIDLDPNQPMQEMRDTVVHEALHLIDDVFDLGLKHSQTKRLARGLSQFIAQLEVDDAPDEER